MASSLNDPQLVFAANKALLAAKPAITRVSNFSTDFSADAAQPGATMKVHVFDTAAATAYNASTNNYGTVNGSIANATVTFTNRVKKTYAYNPTDKLATNPAIWTRMGEAAGVAIARAVDAAVCGLVTLANIPKTGSGTANNEVVFASATKATLADLRDKCDKVGADPADTVLLLTPKMFAEVLSIFDASTFGGTEAIRGGVVPGLYGFKAVMQAHLSTTAAEKLNGALIPSEALVVAGRTIPADDMGGGAECGFTTDNESGLTVGTYAFVDHATREHKFTMEALFGAAIIKPADCVRLVSAATA